MLYPLQDLLYRTTGLADSSGVVREAYDTDAYGKTLIFRNSGSPPGQIAFSNGDTQVASPTCPFIFTGQRLDVETGLYYCKRRYYSPVLGRFLRRDPSLVDINLYCYCGDGPTGETDASGLDWSMNHVLQKICCCAAARAHLPAIHNLSVKRCGRIYTPERRQYDDGHIADVNVPAGGLEISPTEVWTLATDSVDDAAVTVFHELEHTGQPQVTNDEQRMNNEAGAFKAEVQMSINCGWKSWTRATMATHTWRPVLALAMVSPGLSGSPPGHGPASGAAPVLRLVTKWVYQEEVDPEAVHNEAFGQYYRGWYKGHGSENGRNYKVLSRGKSQCTDPKDGVKDVKFPASCPPGC